jgi:hypothetical protein
VRALLWPVFARSTLVQPAIMVSGTTDEGTPLACVLSVVVHSAFHCGFGHDRWGSCCGFCSLCRRELSHSLCCRVRQVMAQLWPLIARSAWSQTATVLAGTTGEGASQASVRSVGVGSASHCGDGTTGEGAAIASVRSIGLGSVSHCVGGHDR